MGNYRLKLSDMICNAWFYKLKDMGKTRKNTHSVKKKQPSQHKSAATTTTTTLQPAKPKQQQGHWSQYPRRLYYFTRELIPSDRFYNSPTKPKSTYTHFSDSPRKSSKRRRLRTTNKAAPTLVSSSVSAGCSCSATIWTKSESLPDYSSSTVDSSPEPELEENCVPEFRSDHVIGSYSFDNMVARSSSCGCQVNPDNAKDIVVDVDDNNGSFAKKIDNKVDGFDSLSDLRTSSSHQ